MKSYIFMLKRWALSVIDLKRAMGIIYIPRYIRNYITYKSLSKTNICLNNTYPCLTDWVKKTPFDAHYFYQSAWLSRQLKRQLPRQQHLDIGSDVRMIAVISAFVPTEFADFRPLDVSLSNLTCTQGSVTALPQADNSVESLSCLHVVEHVGLGRYGDPIDPDGSKRALSELARILAPNGLLFLSVPVGAKDVTHYNAHRVFNPETIISLLSSLELKSFSLVNDQGVFIEEASPYDAFDQDYGCGMFIFKKESFN